MAGIKIVDLPALGRDLLSTDLLEMSIGGTASRKITGQEIMNASKLNVGATPIVSGTVGRVLFQGTGNVLQQSSSLFWDSTNNRLGIGTSTPTTALDVVGTIKGTYVNTALVYGSGDLDLAVAGGSTGILIKSATRNVLLNTTTDAGFRLDVNGTARVQGNTTFLGTIAGSNAARFVIAAQNFAVNITSNNPTNGEGSLITTGAITTTDSQTKNVINVNNAVTSTSASFNTLNGFAFTSNINQTLGTIRGLFIAPTLTASTDFRAIETTAGNIIFNGGNVGIGTTSPSTLLHVAGNITIGGASATTVSSTYNSTTRNQIRYTNGASFEFHEGVNERVRLAPASGNVLINTTTDAGFRLDVNGTARVSSTTTIGTSAHPFGTNLLTLISDQGSASFRIGGGSTVVCTSSISAVNLSANDFVQCVRVLVGSSARLNGGTLDWLSITNWAQSSLGSGNVSANLATFGTAYATINASAQVEIASTTKGFLPPRMTNAQRTAIVSPAVGLIVYCTDVTEGLWVYKSTGWTFIV